jgi:hypothetical protein
MMEPWTGERGTATVQRTETTLSMLTAGISRTMATGTITKIRIATRTRAGIHKAITAQFTSADK